MMVGANRLLNEGIGNGSISIIIFAGIVAGLRQPLPILSSKARQGDPALPRVAVGCGISICGDVLCCICWAWSAPHLMVNYAKRQQRSSCLCCTERTFTAESEYGGGNPGNLRFQYYSVPGDHRVMVRGRYWLELADNNFAVFAARATALCVTLCVCNHLLLFLLHGVGFNPRETTDNLKKSVHLYREFVRESKRRSISIK